MHEPLEGLFNSSHLMILDFDEITDELPNGENIQRFFEQVEQTDDPKLPQNRQRFNERMLESTGARYLVSRYLEDRSAMLAGSSIAREGRTLHLGIDIFSREQETVVAPCDGMIVRVEKEPEDHSFGNFIIFEPDDVRLPYIFFGHLEDGEYEIRQIKEGEPIARLGTWENGENGGWSIHLHLQLLSELPPEGEHPKGYASREGIEEARRLYPDPMELFPDWEISS